MGLSKRRGSGTWRAIGLSVAMLGAAAPARGDTAVPNTFSAGTTISASQVNDNFAALTAALPTAAQIYNYNSGSLTSTTVYIVGLTVTPPADGLMIVTGSAKYTITQSAAGADSVVAGLEMSTGGPTSGGHDSRLGLDTTGGTAEALTSSLDVSHVFTVTGGVATTFKMYARKLTGTSAAGYLQPYLHVLFVPNQLSCTAAAGTSNYGCQ